jgi:hypothetical protein
MESIFNTLSNEKYRDGNHVCYIIKFKHIQPLCKKWSKNRDPDMSRVVDMYEHYKVGGYIPKLIHLAELEGEGLVCYDGNHRREVMKLLGNDGYDVDCIVDIMFNTTKDDVYTAFETINKLVDVPEIYLDDTLDIKDDVLSLVKIYETKYKEFLSKTPKCRSPNFNRDVFTDNITKIYKYLHCSKTIQEISELLNKLNDEYSKNKLCRLHSTYKQNIIDKCKKHNLWLFLEREISCEHIEKLINKKKFGIFY